MYNSNAFEIKCVQLCHVLFLSKFTSKKLKKWKLKKQHRKKKKL